MSTEQPEALRLADWFSVDADLIQRHSLDPDSLEELETYLKAAAELRRLHEVNQELLEALVKLCDYANDSNDCQYGTLSTSLVLDIAEAAIAKAKGESNDTHN